MECYSKSSERKKNMLHPFILIYSNPMFFTRILHFAYYTIKIKVGNTFFCFLIFVLVLKYNYYVLKKCTDKI